MWKIAENVIREIGENVIGKCYSVSWRDIKHRKYLSFVKSSS